MKLRGMHNSMDFGEETDTLNKQFFYSVRSGDSVCLKDNYFIQIFTELDEHFNAIYVLVFSDHTEQFKAIYVRLSYEDIISLYLHVTGMKEDFVDRYEVSDSFSKSVLKLYKNLSDEYIIFVKQDKLKITIAGNEYLYKKMIYLLYWNLINHENNLRKMINRENRKPLIARTMHDVLSTVMRKEDKRLTLEEDTFKVWLKLQGYTLTKDNALV